MAKLTPSSFSWSGGLDVPIRIDGRSVAKVSFMRSSMEKRPRNCRRGVGRRRDLLRRLEKGGNPWPKARRPTQSAWIRGLIATARVRPIQVGVAAILAEVLDVEVAAFAGDDEELLHLAKGSSPVVLLLDLGLLGRGGAASHPGFPDREPLRGLS